MCNQVQEKPKEENETEKKVKEDVKDLKLEMEFDDEPAASTSQNDPPSNTTEMAD